MTTAPAGRQEIQEWIRTRLFDEVPVAIAVVGRDFRVLDANRRFEDSFGRWRDRPCHVVYKGRPDPCPRCAARESLADGRIRTREEQGVGRGGAAIDYLVQVVPVVRPDGEIPCVIEMSTDITSVKRMEREKREADRLAAVGETVSGIAHGVKNILMGLEGGMYAVNSGLRLGDDGRIARGWTTMEQNVARISAFVKEFLDFAKGREARLSPADPDGPARLVMDAWREQAVGAGVRLEADLAAGPAPVPLDAEGIRDCLANLVSNAIDACTLAEVDREFTVTLGSRIEGGLLVYEVADNGQGMDYEISRKVFSRFFTTKGSDRGTGLGLLTTRRIVHQHGGTISFRTEEGKGSVFRIEIPLADGGGGAGSEGGAP